MTHGNLSVNYLRKMGYSTLQGAIDRKYPGKITALKEQLGIIETVKPPGYWHDIENIKREALAVYQDKGRITEELLYKLGKGGLRHAIRYKYPGGFYQFRIDLGSDNTRRPNHFWTKSNIEEEAKEFFQLYGKLDVPELKKRGRMDLYSGIRKKYPGGWRQLKEDLGLSNKEALTITPDEANKQLKKLLEE